MGLGLVLTLGETGNHGGVSEDKSSHWCLNRMARLLGVDRAGDVQRLETAERVPCGLSGFRQVWGRQRTQKRRKGTCRAGRETSRTHRKRWGAGGAHATWGAGRHLGIRCPSADMLPLPFS